MNTQFCKSAIAGLVVACLCTATVFAQSERPYRQPLVPAADVSVNLSNQDFPPSPPAEVDSGNATADSPSDAPKRGDFGNAVSDCGCASSGPCGKSCAPNCCDSYDCFDPCCKCKHEPLIKIEDCCPLECEEQEFCRLFDCCCCLKQHGTTVTGWFAAGIMANVDEPISHFNGPVTFVDRDQGQVNQVYLVAEMATPADNCGWFMGGRVDYYYGSDYFFTTAAGLDGTPQGNVARWGNDSFRYGSSLPQAYLELAYDDLKIKGGHFYTPIGYEVAPAKDNFFVTRSYAMQYAEPLTHTGVLASKPVNDNWSWSAGVVSGWNTFNTDSRAEFLGGLTYTEKDWGTLAFTLISGDDSTVNLPGIGPYENRTMYSLVWTRNFTSRFTYILQHDLGIQQDASTVTGTEQAEWYGLNSYCLYKLNCCWTAGWRLEWLRDDDGFVVTGLRPGNPLVGNFFAGNFYETALGLNYKPNANLNIRPELRYDWFSATNPNVGSQNPYNDNTSSDQFLFGIDIIYQF